ncbi:MAG: hypothetical protein GWP09_01285, partial [Nitrospiraceae bacterium]|nr:hypothetical protein [Nitrospiraceae bacterium]
MSLINVIKDSTKKGVAYVGLASIITGAAIGLNGCTTPEKPVYYPKTEITKVKEDFPNGKVEVHVKGIDTGNIKVTSL